MNQEIVEICCLNCFYRCAAVEMAEVENNLVECLHVILSRILPIDQILLRRLGTGSDGYRSTLHLEAQRSDHNCESMNL
jgi:hypothetical protein